MIKIRKSRDRGHFDHGWLDTFHTFSFADYRDPNHTGFRTLRVINEDRVQPGQGFGTHSHRDMEILTYVLQGTLEHKDSMGNTSVIRPGDVQRMTAGTGVTHSEFNHSGKDTVHLLQIWILPDKKGLTPGYEQRAFPLEEKVNRLRLVASKNGRGTSVNVHQNVLMYDCELKDERSLTYQPALGGGVWLQVIGGMFFLRDQGLDAGDGAAIQDESKMLLEAKRDCGFLLFDLG